MKAKMNRYYLSLWDVGKPQLYGRAQESVQAATLWVEPFGPNQAGETRTIASWGWLG
jgi:hypothetical protein